MKKITLIFLVLSLSVYFAVGDVYAKTKLIKLEKKYEIRDVWLAYHGKRYLVPYQGAADNEVVKKYCEALVDSWGWSLDDVVEVKLRKIERMEMVANVTIRPGTYTVSPESHPELLYAVEYNQTLRRIDKDAFDVIYGEDWDNHIIIPDCYFVNYTVLPEWMDIYLEEAPNPFYIGQKPSGVPHGCIIDRYNSCDNYHEALLVGHYHIRFVTEEGFTANNYNSKFFIKYGGLNYPLDSNYPVASHLPEYDFISNFINPETIHDINGGLGYEAKAVAFNWTLSEGGLPINLSQGDQVDVSYNDGSIKDSTICSVRIDPSFSEYYIQPQFNKRIPLYTERQNYKFKILKKNK